MNAYNGMKMYLYLYRLVTHCWHLSRENRSWLATFSQCVTDELFMKNRLYKGPGLAWAPKATFKERLPHSQREASELLDDVKSHVKFSSIVLLPLLVECRFDSWSWHLCPWAIWIYHNCFCLRMGFIPVFLVHTASTLVYRFPQACELQWLDSLMRYPWFHYQK